MPLLFARVLGTPVAAESLVAGSNLQHRLSLQPGHRANVWFIYRHRSPCGPSEALSSTQHHGVPWEGPERRGCKTMLPGWWLPLHWHPVLTVSFEEKRSSKFKYKTSCRREASARGLRSFVHNPWLVQCYSPGKQKPPEKLLSS